MYLPTKCIFNINNRLLHFIYIKYNVELAKVIFKYLGVIVVKELKIRNHVDYTYKVHFSGRQVSVRNAISPSHLNYAECILYVHKR